MVASTGTRMRAAVDGKFFRLGTEKFYIKGVTYGAFAPNGRGEPFPDEQQTRRDFSQICALGANLARIYHLPPPWLLDVAGQNGLQVLIDVPWNKQVCFVESGEARAEARQAVKQAALRCAAHPAVFGISVVNEIPADVVRWSGAEAVSDFIDDLAGIVKAVDPECLCTFGNYPPTEFLRPKEIDFLCFNIFLHARRPFENYLARLQMIADTRPLVLGEIGIDSISQGQERQAEILDWQIESAYRGGLAGAVVYSFTDEWFKDGRQIMDWGFGLTDCDRNPKPAFQAVQSAFSRAPYFSLDQYPMVSVVVGCYNGARTLKICLESMQDLNYPEYEVILVDDGSTDGTSQIPAAFPHVRLIQHKSNLGLSAARNTGIAAAQGEIVAFTDADCRADRDWLYYIVGDLLRNTGIVSIGGHNLLPPDDSCVAAAVMDSPGGPTHVMLTDRLAEHIPGCNMAFYRWVLNELGGFDPVFRRAGDDVDICWRLQQHGYEIGFSPAGFVWHYRRPTVVEYLKQQHGYGEAEALLVRKHPEHFSWFGGGIWQGRIYSTAKFGVVFRPPRIYFGRFATGFFQSLYSARPSAALMFFTNLEYQALVTLPLCVLAVAYHFLILPAAISLLLSISVCGAATAQAFLPRKKRRFWSRPLIAVLFFLQPLVRGWARYQGRLSPHPKSLANRETLDSLTLKTQKRAFGEVWYWAENGVDRCSFIRRVLEQLDKQEWQSRPDHGWNEFDVEVFGSRWRRLQLTTAAEAHQGGKWMIRCRLRAAWTFLAKTAFLAGACGQLLLIGLWNPAPGWHWLVLLTLVLLALWLRQQGRDLQRIFAAFLDDVAKQLDLVKVEPAAVATKPSASPSRSFRSRFPAAMKSVREFARRPFVRRAKPSQNQDKTSQ